jgi:hypothetical protein
MKWSFSGVWNDTLLKEKDRPAEPRDYIWASEIGGSFVDRYLKMTGVKPTNPPNNRALRKFQAGNIWEFVVQMVLTRAGILENRQEKLRFQYDGLLMVSGKNDFIAGGTPDLERAHAEISNMEMPEMIRNASIAIVNHLKALNATELKRIVLEVKSASDMIWPKYEIGGPDPRHACQTFHYLKCTGMDEGHVVYINKDNCLLLEFEVSNPGMWEGVYRKDIEIMTDLYKNGNWEDFKEQEVTFDAATGKFRVNWKIEYSNYLTKVYGYEEPFMFREKWDKRVGSMNRVFARCVNGDKMTDKNKIVIEEAKMLGFQWDDYVDIVKAKGINVEEEEVGSEEASK